MKRLLFISILIFITVLLFPGCNPSKTKTIINLKTAYKIEIIGSTRYLAFAQKTREEGLQRLSVLFLAVSKAKNIYANNFKSEIEKLGAKVESVKPVFDVKTTLENLREAISSENINYTGMYPIFIKEASKENLSDAGKLFNRVIETEMNHTVLYYDAIQAIEQNWTNAFYTLYYICPTCGNICYPDQAEDKCKICSTKKEKFIHIG